jgi:hypothetical protein
VGGLAEWWSENGVEEQLVADERARTTAAFMLPTRTHIVELNDDSDRLTMVVKS